MESTIPLAECLLRSGLLSGKEFLEALERVARPNLALASFHTQCIVQSAGGIFPSAHLAGWTVASVGAHTSGIIE